MSDLVSRRRLVAAAIGGGVAALAPGLGRPAEVSAADPNDVVLGAANTSATTTEIHATADRATGMKVTGGAAGIGLLAATPGLPSTVPAGREEGGTGVVGSGGLFGTGVRGDSDQLIGVHGVALRGSGVQGDTDIGTGVVGSAANGTGVRAESATGRAFIALGQVEFSTAGLAVVRPGRSSVTIRPGINITSSTKVLATLQTSAGGRTSVHRVSRDTVNDRVTIYLTARATRSARVAYFVIS